MWAIDQRLVQIDNLLSNRSVLQFFIGWLAHIHTYIHNWALQPFSQDYGLASNTTHIVCVNFMREWRDLQFNVDSELQIFEKLFHGNFIYSQSFYQKSAERKSLIVSTTLFLFWWRKLIPKKCAKKWKNTQRLKRSY